MVRHKEYLTLNWDALKARMRLPILIDGRWIWDTAKPSADGWTYRGVGVSTQR